MGIHGSSVPQRQLGRHLKLAREEAGINLEPAAKTLEWSRARMYRIERGETTVRTHDVEAMCRLYGVTTKMTDVLLGLARESKAKGWWHAYGEVIPSWFQLYVGMEATASRIRQFESSLIPGLLQTPDYAAEVIRTKPDVTEQEVAAKVALRLERQRILTRRRPKAPDLEVIVDEAVLRRPIADHDAWLAQLAHLANSNRVPSVTVRILPSGVGPHLASVANSFHIFEFPAIGTRPPEPTTIYSENLTGALYLDKPAEVAVYDQVWQRLGELALSQEDSEDLLTAIIKEAVDD
ncbi:helix-turn-helix domain-containing protein [Plantactinospora solaniradicis]|uniref:Helix-turn-helix domain-containing protein n=1 Tax=Plantactinospora solaniradicis TaxID=1723736 RepID=A0ABW1KEG6_9ACTN